MKRDSRLSSVLHALLHMAQHDGPMTSDALGQCLGTNPVVVRRTMGLLREAGLVAAARGHSGGWRIAADLSDVSLRQLHEALGEPAIFAIGNRNETPKCLVEQAVNAALDHAFRDAKRVTRHVPGLADMHRMAGLLLAERVPPRGRILVLGAGGGMELRAFADLQPGWRFDGVDPSADMIAQARLTMGAQKARAVLHHGYIDAAPDGPFDGAACLLVLHFLPREERLRTLRALANRLRLGAPLVVAHHSFPVSDGQKDLWLRRNADWLTSAGTPVDQATAGIATMRERLPVLTPAEDEGLLHDAGFDAVQLFYAAFTFKGWVCYRAGD